MRFLTGLNDNFNTVKSQILLLDPLPSITKFFSMVLQFERQNVSPILDDSKVLVNASDSRSHGSGAGKPNSSSSGGNSKGKCTYCHKSNHVVENCFKKHGVPPHMLQKYPGYAHHSAAEGGDSSGNSSAASQDTRNVSTAPSITQEQYDKLMNLLQSSSVNSGSTSATSHQVSSFKSAGHTPTDKGKQGKNLAYCHFSFICHNITLDTWIIDSGASHHICASLHWFHSYSEITPMVIKLPNGNHVTTKCAGTINFSPEFSITNVLYVPSFSVNLISVYQLCHNAQYSLEFTDTGCFIHEQKSLRMIGSGESKDGLYYYSAQTNKQCITSNHSFSQPFVSANNTTLPDNVLWHFRLGHLSHSRLALLQSKFPFIVSDSHAVCDICHYAKHRKLPFVNSYSKSIKPFDLIHFDIWGPVSITSLHNHSYFLTAVMTLLDILGLFL
jgi:Zn-finger protein